MNIERPIANESLAAKVEVKAPGPADLENWFTYHSPTDEDVDKYLRIRSNGLAFAKAIMEECPNGADKTVAIRSVREAVMWANAAIACCGKTARP